jgi:hypothetical protein
MHLLTLQDFFLYSISDQSSSARVGNSTFSESNKCGEKSQSMLVWSKRILCLSFANIIKIRNEIETE